MCCAIKVVITAFVNQVLIIFAVLKPNRVTSAGAHPRRLAPVNIETWKRWRVAGDSVRFDRPERKLSPKSPENTLLGLKMLTRDCDYDLSGVKGQGHLDVQDRRFEESGMLKRVRLYAIVKPK